MAPEARPAALLYVLGILGLTLGPVVTGLASIAVIVTTNVPQPHWTGSAWLVLTVGATCVGAGASVASLVASRPYGEAGSGLRLLGGLGCLSSTLTVCAITVITYVGHAMLEHPNVMFGL